MEVPCQIWRNQRILLNTLSQRNFAVIDFRFGVLYAFDRLNKVVTQFVFRNICSGHCPGVIKIYRQLEYIVSVKMDSFSVFFLQIKFTGNSLLLELCPKVSTFQNFGTILL